MTNSSFMNPRKPYGPNEPRTYENTTLVGWWKLANKAFTKRGLPEPTFGPVNDAYKMGETPETWADYVLNS